METTRHADRERHVCPECRAVYGVPTDFAESSIRCRRCGTAIWIHPIAVAAAPVEVESGMAEAGPSGVGAASASMAHHHHYRVPPPRRKVLAANAIFVAICVVFLGLCVAGIRALTAAETPHHAAPTHHGSTSQSD